MIVTRLSGAQLGGATLHCTKSGVADHFAHDEAESFEILRDIISSLNLEDEALNKRYVIIALSGFSNLGFSDLNC